MAASATTAVPWWGTGIFLVAAALFGGTVALVSTWLSDKRKAGIEEQLAKERYRRDDEQRWDGMVRDVAAKYIGVAVYAADTALDVWLNDKDRTLKAIQLRMKYANQWWFVLYFKTIGSLLLERPERRARKAYRDARDEVGKVLAELMLVASDEVVEKAQFLAHSLEDMYRDRSINLNHDMSRAFALARSSLIQTVRKDLVARPPA